MSSYKPPFARMRQIRANAPPPPSKYPQDVDAALAVVPEAPPVPVVPPVEEIRGPVGAVEVIIEPGPDLKFGTADDHKHIVQPGGEAPVDEPVAEVGNPAKLKYDMTMKKADLADLADANGVEYPEGATKAEIVEALDQHFGR